MQRRSKGASVNNLDTHSEVRLGSLTLESDSPGAHRERPIDASGGGVRGPSRTELFDDGRDGIRALCARTLYRGPGGEVADELGEGPLRRHRERGRTQLVEWEL